MALGGTHYFECECGGDEHTLRFILDKEHKKIYTTFFLNHYDQWYKRLWRGIKYIFGYKCKYGHWDVWTLRYEDIDRLKEVLNKINN